MQITINNPLPIMNVKELSASEVLAHSKREYNPGEWEHAVGRYAKYADVIFLERFNSPNSYPEIFAIYTIPEGIRLIGEVSYSGSIVDSGFAKVSYDSQAIYTERPFEKGLVANNKEGRKWMAKMSSEFGYIFSNKLPLSKLEAKTIDIPETQTKN